MDPRTWFTTAAAGFETVVAGIDRAQLRDLALGVWDVRSLLGHTCRAFLTIEAYLQTDQDDPAPLTLASPADYFRATAAGAADPEQVAQRGRDAGTALGDRPAEAVRTIAVRVVDRVARTRDEARVVTPYGTMALIEYLPTRAFELTVHGIDLARATEQPEPPQLLEAAVPAIALCATMTDSSARVAVLMALTGREGLPEGFSVV